MESKRADNLLNGLVHHPEDGEIANDLLAMFHDGYPVGNLRMLLSSPDEAAVRTGVWIASELGERCRPLIAEICRLLSHSDARIRYFAIDSLMSILPDDARIAAQIIGMLADREEAVRLKAMEFIAGAPSEHLLAASRHFSELNLELSNVAGIRLLADRKPSSDKISAFIESDDPVRRKFGAAAAARFVDLDESPIQAARASPDSDVSRFAEDFLSLRS